MTDKQSPKQPQKFHRPRLGTCPHLVPVQCFHIWLLQKLFYQIYAWWRCRPDLLSPHFQSVRIKIIKGHVQCTRPPIAKWGPKLSANKTVCSAFHGFRENHSTELAIKTIYDELLKHFDNKLITCSLFLDLSKAFDYCDHEILLDKLYHYGIRGVSHKLFSNILRNRKQCTEIRTLKSFYKRISCGVPQGSVI